ncbi:Sec-independent protein translocase protein TatA [Austwickia sp. TVS 96-490-7B]|uniref:Sec-independent protein translocase subunit TatA n=1 Tax=Austwickia sp. TVS 96-490-7B TaxID=2830843 RepID=UPI001C56774D|nr:Sec-independent protein translocase subunit TatA [Austwickia sp. TVS 96-490-7B]MBW3085405.1 Sec-independent protein translocase protein TatA [Austwickia sp. TVS 96-490-7B]
MWRNALEPWHIIIVALVIVIVFGWNKLPDMARSLGRSLRILKAEVDEMRRDDAPSAASQDTVSGATVPPSAATTPAAGATATSAAGQPAKDTGSSAPAAPETPEQRTARLRAEVAASLDAEEERARIEAEMRAQRAAKAAGAESKPRTDPTL